MNPSADSLHGYTHVVRVGWTKIYVPRALEHEGTDEFTQDPDWEKHMRLKINTRLDGVYRDLVYQARSDEDEVKLQKSWATGLLLNRRSALTRDCGAQLLRG